MSTLNKRARDLVAEVGEDDGPTAQERAHLRASVLARVGATVAVGSVGAAVSATAKGTTALAPLSDVGAGTGLSGVSTAGKAGSVAVSAVAKGSMGAFATKALAVIAIMASAGATGYVAVSRIGRGVPPSTAVAPAESAPGSTAVIDMRAKPSLSRASSEPAAVAPLASVAVNERAATAAEKPSASRPTGAARIPPSPSASGTHDSPSVSPETFDAETVALAGVLAALRDGRSEEALSALDEQDARYAHGALGEERAATRVDALCALGRKAEARTLAAGFVVDHPRSLLADRVAAACNATPPR